MIEGNIGMQSIIVDAFTGIMMPLSDLLVIEFAGVLAGSGVGMCLAELGAGVVKVENHSAGGGCHALLASGRGGLRNSPVRVLLLRELRKGVCRHRPEASRRKTGRAAAGRSS
jgi:hypothetical protein